MAPHPNEVELIDSMIITHKNVPIYNGPKSADYWKIVSFIEGDSITFDEWRSKCTLKGLNLTDFLKQNEYRRFIWNNLGNQYYESFDLQ